jgi:hypothetical protein
MIDDDTSDTYNIYTYVRTSAPVISWVFVIFLASSSSILAWNTVVQEWSFKLFDLDPAAVIFGYPLMLLIKLRYLSTSLFNTQSKIDC